MQTQERIYNYFERNPKLHVLFIFDQMGVIINDLEGVEWREGYLFHVFDGAWFNTKYNIENTWKNNRVVLLFTQDSYPHTEQQQLAFPLLDMLKANMEYKEEDYASYMQQYNLPEKFHQLYVIDETFAAEPAKFKYINLKNGCEVEVETLEKVSNVLIVPANAPVDVPVSEDEGSDVSSSEQGESEQPLSTRVKQTQLQERTDTYRMGQTGVSYQKLFAPYLQDATEITVEDPWIRNFWQMHNFTEFVTMLIETRPVDGLKLNLVTWEPDENKCAELIDKLNDFQDDFQSFGIEFNYQLRDFHDRCIKTDTGWTITLGRGLDIFDRYNALSISAIRQDKRKCRDFTVTYMKDK